MSGAVRTRSIGEIDPGLLHQRLCERGLWLDYGCTTTRLQSDSRALAAQLRIVYAQFPFVDHGEWADTHVVVRRQRGLRRWIRPQVAFTCDFEVPFAPFPASSPLPMFEWGSNWLIGHRLTHLLLLHAGVVERNGLALVLPATPGSGKSTLTAALSLRGWRLLSDEFGAFCPIRRRFIALLKPVALKNDSIRIIKDFAPEAPIGPSFPKTRKGTVAHLAAASSAVQRRHEWVLPGAVVTPKWAPNQAASLQRLAPHVQFSLLAFNAFNYQDGGAANFDATAHLTRDVPGWQLVYSDLNDAVEQLDDLWRGLPASRQPRRQAGGADP